MTRRSSISRSAPSRTRLGLADLEAALVERLAGDHAGEVGSPTPSARAGRPASRSRPSRRPRRGNAAHMRRTSSRSGPSSIPSRVERWCRRPAERPRSSSSASTPRAPLLRLRSSPTRRPGRPARPRPRRPGRAKVASACSRKSASVKAAVPEDHPLDARAQRPVDRVQRPQPAAVLHRQPELAHDPLGVAEVGGLAVARAVEVDHVQRPGAGHPEVARRLERVVAVHGLPREVALLQAHGAAVADVHRGQEDHAAAQAREVAQAAPARRARTSRGGTAPRTPAARATTLANSPP